MKKRPNTKTARTKPSRKALAPQKAAKSLPPLPQFDSALRYQIVDAKRFLKTSHVTVYRLIREGILESFLEGRNRYITGRSIARAMLPPHERIPLPIATNKHVSAQTTAA